VGPLSGVRGVHASAVEVYIAEDQSDQGSSTDRLRIGRPVSYAKQRGR
jgi:hypothetical protein